MLSLSVGKCDSKDLLFFFLWSRQILVYIVVHSQKELVVIVGNICRSKHEMKEIHWGNPLREYPPPQMPHPFLNLCRPRILHYISGPGPGIWKHMFSWPLLSYPETTKICSSEWLSNKGNNDWIVSHIWNGPHLNCISQMTLKLETQFLSLSPVCDLICSRSVLTR